MLRIVTMREKCQVFYWNSWIYSSVLLAPDILTSMLVEGKQVVPESSVSTSENLRSIFCSLFALSFMMTRKKHSKIILQSDTHLHFFDTTFKSEYYTINAGTDSSVISVPLYTFWSPLTTNGILSMVVNVIWSLSSTYFPSWIVISIADAFWY